MENIKTTLDPKIKDEKVVPFGLGTASFLDFRRVKSVTECHMMYIIRSQYSPPRAQNTTLAPALTRNRKVKVL